MTKTKDEVVQEFRVQSIQDAALRVIARKGMAGASMQEIAEEAGVAKGTIYLYFENQQQLLDRTIDYAISQLMARLEAVFEAPTPLRESLTRLVEAEIEFFDSHRDFFQLYCSLSGIGGRGGERPQCDRMDRPQYHTYLDRLTRYLEKRMKGGEIRACDCRRLAVFFEEGSIGVILLRMSDPKPRPVAEEAEWLVSTLFEGISKKRSRA